MSFPSATTAAMGSRARSSTKLRAIDDATEMQATVSRDCVSAGLDLPPYTLQELIGKGSFGRVYRASTSAPTAPQSSETRTNTAEDGHRNIHSSKLVAIKIINIDLADLNMSHSFDHQHPDRSDGGTFAEILKEVNTVKELSEKGAKNINFILDTLLIGHQMWLVTEYCAGGSVSTLMRPTGKLPERYIQPILREVTEALFWVHSHGVIHRDIKCANVLISEEGKVQLCDFGVAGLLKGRFDKRKTVAGTLQWMAPELFDKADQVGYGKEVDVWAFGSMAIEAATGMPPNATLSFGVDLEEFGRYLRESSPRLEGSYSEGLKDLVAFCLVPDPAKRPGIGDVQRHRYIFGTETTSPTPLLSELVASFKKWEAQGGDRKSLFSSGGAQGLLGCIDGSQQDHDDGWNYGTMDEAFCPSPGDFSSVNAMNRSGDVAHGHGQRRRRIPRKPLPRRDSKPVPLEKAFDPNTISNYRTNAQNFYRATSIPDLRNSCLTEDEDDEGTIRELSPVKATAASAGTTSQSPETIRPKGKPAGKEKNVTFHTARTQDWTFPNMSTVITSPTGSVHSDPGTGTAPSPPIQAISSPERNILNAHAKSVSTRTSIASLIDIDAGLMPITVSIDLAGPEHSVVSVTSGLAPTIIPTEDFISPMTLEPVTNPMDSIIMSSLETGTRLEAFPAFEHESQAEEETSYKPREPSLYIPTDQLHVICDAEEVTEPDTEVIYHGKLREPSLYIPTLGIIMDSRAENCLDSPTIPEIVVDGSGDGSPEPRRSGGGTGGRNRRMTRRMPPAPPRPPAEEVVLGNGGTDALREEMERLIGSMWEHLEFTEEIVVVSQTFCLSVAAFGARGGGWHPVVALRLARVDAMGHGSNGQGGREENVFGLHLGGLIGMYEVLFRASMRRRGVPGSWKEDETAVKSRDEADGKKQKGRIRMVVVPLQQPISSRQHQLVPLGFASTPSLMLL
ncbi:kinase-like domain-containing protein [Apiosordaria backusii]|uniref:Kinase-like domain-containing protein n=1 Tax=Apiosordaria backusii TaxID=314023 RepID=A0AA40BLA1_9PEZI|nr:kinase-like domain-containing protein [Apiosordaria backusii]